MPADQQARAAAELSVRMQNEVDPLIRADVVRALGELQAPAAADALRLAVNDKESEVRIAACSAWRRQGGPQAAAILTEALGSDTDDDVRLAAARALGSFQEPTAVRGLATLLDDPNPALQYRAMESLRNSTGRDLGYDVVAWRNFVESGADGPRNGPSLVERLRDRL